MAGHALPAFHTLGIIVQLLVSLYAMTPIALYPPIASTPASTPMLPSPDNILEHLRRTHSNCLMIIPALLQTWAQDSNAVELLASLEFVVRFPKFRAPRFLIEQCNRNIGVFGGCATREVGKLHGRCRRLYNPGLRRDRVRRSLEVLQKRGRQAGLGMDPVLRRCFDSLVSAGKRYAGDPIFG